MYQVILVLIIAIVLLVVVRIILNFSDKIKFISKGLDSGFKLKQINLLWKLAKTSGLEDPTSLFLSVYALNKSIAYVLSTAKANHTENTKETQEFLTKLYQYRTEVELEPSQKGGLKSSKGISVGQKLRIVLKGQGIFSSTVLGNGRNLTISLPLKNNIIVIGAEDWVGKQISVYLWRVNDANYIFDTYVKETGVFNSKVVLNLEQTDNLIRAQKRKSVRCQCKIPARLYIVKSETEDLSAPESGEGLRCIIEDISEGGAFIRIGGKAQKNMQIKLQFTIDESLIVMHGFIKGVEYLEGQNQSRLHFEAEEVDPRMKISILTYVYNVLPQEEKEVLEATTLAQKDSEESFNIPSETIINSDFNIEKVFNSDNNITADSADTSVNLNTDDGKGVLFGQSKPLTESPWEDDNETK